MSIQYYIGDTETSGLNSTTQEVIEISLIRASDKTQINRLIKADFPKNASIDALNITGKTISDLYKGVSKQQAVSDIVKFFDQDGLTPEHRCVVFHNAPFDRRFIFSLFEKTNTVWPATMWIDTIPIMRDYIKKNNINQKSVKLQECLNLLKIANVGGWHSAKGDSRNTYFLWKKLMEEMDILDYIKTIPHEF
jgi:DNA polymerase III alpha subunit (gram-positive type)